METITIDGERWEACEQGEKELRAEIVFYQKVLSGEKCTGQSGQVESEKTGFDLNAESINRNFMNNSEGNV